MRPTAATVLCCIAQRQPCTKLSVKTHSGYSMATVLAAVDELQREGWVLCEHIPATHGGKPHAALSLGARRVYGVCQTADGVQIASASPLGDCRIERVLPPDAVGVCVSTPQNDLPCLTPAAALCCAAMLTCPTAVIDHDWTLHTAKDAPFALGDLPSPLVSDRRLSYAAAYRVATQAQQDKLLAELTLWITRLCRVQRVLFAWREPPVDAMVAARAALYCELYRAQRKTRP